jgi:MOSC domain-containing protein
MPTLCRIRIFPVKSLDAQSVDEATLLPSGALLHDRRFAFVDRSGDYVNGKRFPAIQRLRSHFDPARRQLTLQVDGAGPTLTFDMRGSRAELVGWLGEYLGEPVTLAEDEDRGFPDDTESPGPTIISTATLAEVAGWFPGITVDEARDRFRANLEIAAHEPFWEDRLVAEGTGVVRFAIGEAELLGTNPCARCPVPTRNPYTGEAMREFARTFTQRRQQTLPGWAATSRFDHFYRLSVNTRPVHARASRIRVGDEVRIMGVE